MQTAADLLEELYMVCNVCKEGKVIVAEAKQQYAEFQSKHASCQSGTSMITAREFLSTYLRDGYIDIDREWLEPIFTSIGAPEPDEKLNLEQTKPMPFGAPKGVSGARDLQRTLRREAGLYALSTEYAHNQSQQNPFETTLAMTRAEIALLVEKIEKLRALEQTLVEVIEVGKKHTIVGSGPRPENG